MSDLLHEAITEENEVENETIAQEQEAPAPGYRFTMPDISFSFLAAKTGDGSVEEYIQHPFNINESRGTARVLRGLTGIAGELDYAIIDITLGVLEVMKEGKKSHEDSNPTNAE